MRVAVLFSGGKDSVFAAEVCRMMGWEVFLLTVIPAKDSTMFHYPNLEWCRLQAKAMGLPHMAAKPKKGGEEGELLAAKAALRKMKADGVAAGAIESEYQKERVDRIAFELGIRSFCPIWRTGMQLLEEQCKYLESYVVAVAAYGLGEKDLGARFDREFALRLKSMKPPVSVHLEGGEGETFVAYAPFFSRRLMIREWEKEFSGTCGAAKIVRIS
jgi:predicted ATP pyrophosphatase (TIGR00289 family)